MLEESVALRRQLPEPWWLAQSLVGLGRTLALLGEPGSARPLLEEAEARYREIGDDWGQAISLENLGVVATLQGNYDHAEALFQATLELYLRSEDKVFSLRCLEELAWTAAQRGNFPRAALLLGAVEALGERIGALLPEVLRVEHDRQVAAVRRHLPPAEAVSAWAEGRAMTLEQAVAYALEG
jgi:hypothetical protein